MTRVPEPPTLRPRREAGQALVLVVVMMLIISIGVVAVIAMTGTADGDTKRENARTDALSVAEAGVANGLSILSNSVRPLDPATLPSSSSPQVEAVGGGTVSWYGSVTGDRWTITATSSVPNPTGGGPVSRTVSVGARVGSTFTDPAWKYAYSTGSSCTALDGAVQVTAPLYTRGDLCVSGNATVAGSPVEVTGTIETADSASVGSGGSPVAELHVAGGCRAGSSGPFNTPCTPADGVYATAQDAAPAAIAKPPIDLGFWYANAQPGPAHSCTSGSFPGGFDADGTLNRSLGNVDLFGGTNYDCSVVVGGSQVGRVAWTDGDPGTFVIDGAVFIDGNISVNSDKKVVYSGRGTIYAAGSVALAGSLQLCGAWSAGCDVSGWQPATNMLVLVAGSDTASPGFSVSENARFQGGIYAANDYAESGSAVVQGPKIAERLSMSASADAAWMPFTFLPPGAPMAKPVVVTQGWRG